jgi:hypothetical protein
MYTIWDIHVDEMAALIPKIRTLGTHHRENGIVWNGTSYARFPYRSHETYRGSGGDRAIKLQLVVGHRLRHNGGISCRISA